MHTLETSLVISLVFLLLFSSLALLPRFYDLAQTAARLEVLAVYLHQASNSLYQKDDLICRGATTAGLVTSPQRALELAGLVKDYYSWFSDWLAGGGT